MRSPATSTVTLRSVPVYLKNDVRGSSAAPTGASQLAWIRRSRSSAGYMRDVAYATPPGRQALPQVPELRTTHRKPMCPVEVSVVSADRAAGR